MGAEAAVVVEYLDHNVPAMDSKISSSFQKVLAKQGMQFQLRTKIAASQVYERGVSLTTEPTVLASNSPASSSEMKGRSNVIKR